MAESREKISISPDSLEEKECLGIGTIIILKDLPAMVWKRPSNYPCRSCPYQGKICMDNDGVCYSLNVCSYLGKNKTILWKA